MSRPRIAVLGSGLVGSVLAQDLAASGDLDVTVVDRSRAALKRIPGHACLRTLQADLADGEALRALLRDFEVAAGAVPGFMAQTVLQAAIDARRPLADISFSPDEPLALNELARQAGVPAIVDCGVAPGLSNLLVGRAHAEMETLERVRILVGGLPERRDWPYEYRFVFSPTDVIEEYTRPCRLRTAGRDRIVPALTDVERVAFAGIGTLEAFNTDGLRTLLANIPAPDMVEKTLRYPGHAEKMLLLRETGFLGSRPVRLPGGPQVVPRELTEHLLGRLLARRDDEKEITVMRVEVTGRSRDGYRHVTWDLLDRTDPATGWTSMARTTAFPCAEAVRWLATGRWSKPGVYAPETLGADEGLHDAMLAALADRGIVIRRREDPAS